MNASFTNFVLLFAIIYFLSALLAQLVEQLTLNQRAQGSSPWKCTIEIKHEQGRTQSL